MRWDGGLILATVAVGVLIAFCVLVIVVSAIDTMPPGMFD